MTINIKLLLLLIISLNVCYEIDAQNEYTELEYVIIASGDNSPLNDISVVCFNKHFNLGTLSEKFREENNLNEKLYKKRMLVEIFLGERTKGVDEIRLVNIVENPTEIVVEYETINIDTTNDDDGSHPYVIFQIPKRTKKAIVFVENGVKKTGGQSMYINN